MSAVKVTLTNLPKYSTNKMYAGGHWGKRKKLKDRMKQAIKLQYKHVFKGDRRYMVSYRFFFESYPLDATNCSGMIKMIEDVIFEDDKWDLIDIGGITSRKDKDERVEITIEET